MSAEVWNLDVLCPACGYNLRGLPVDNRCPECGRPADTNQTDQDRRRAERLDAELDEHLATEARAEAQQRRLDDLISAWEERGRQFDRMMELVQAMLRRSQ